MPNSTRSSIKTHLLNSPGPIVEQFTRETKRRCAGFEHLSEDDLRYGFLHALQNVALTDPQCVRLNYRLYANDRLKLDLVIRHDYSHLMACEFKVHVCPKASPRRRDAWDILDDLSRLALANVMWGGLNKRCPSYFVHLCSKKMTNFLRRHTSRLAGLLDAPVGTPTKFDVRTEMEIAGIGGKEIFRSRRPPFELDVHSGQALCVMRDCIERDSENEWTLSVFSVRGDDHHAFNY